MRTPQHLGDRRSSNAGISNRFTLLVTFLYVAMTTGSWLILINSSGEVLWEG